MKDKYPRLPCSPRIRAKVKNYKQKVKNITLPGLVDELISRGLESISMPMILPTMVNNEIPSSSEAADASKPL